MKNLKLFAFAVFFATAIVLSGCGAGGSSKYFGSWIGVWSDGFDDEGIYDVDISKSGAVQGEGYGYYFGNYAEVSGRLTDNSTKKTFRFAANAHAVAYRVELSGDGMFPYSNGYAQIVTARYYVNNNYVGSVQWAIYMERYAQDSEPDDEVKRRLKEIAEGLTKELKLSADNATPPIKKLSQ